MSLTRKLLKELELNDNAIERIIAAHADTVNALKQDRDAALAQSEALQTEAAAIQEEYTAYRTGIETERRIAARRTALCDALTRQGANPQAMPLLLDAITLPEEAWAGDSLADAAAALEPWRTRYSALFAVKSPIPVKKVLPPVHSGGLLTHADVKRMSAADINRHWSAVKTALQNN